jgi:hypothetical protein
MATTISHTLEDHDVFFGRIISMIPRELYKPVDEEEGFESKYYKHKKVALPSDVKKNISKKKKEEKYGMGEPLADDAGQDDDDAMDEGDASDDDGEPKSARKRKGGASGGKNKDEEDDQFSTLRERLKAKLDDMKAARMPKKRAMAPSGLARPLKKLKAAGANGEQPATKGNKNKGASAAAPSSSGSGSNGGDVAAATGGADKASAGGEDGPSLVESLSSSGADLDFSSMQNGGKARLVKTPKGKPGTKKQRLERMLETAEKKRERLQELRNSGDAGKERVKNEQWNDVIGAASGKETIDVNRVKKALKRREQQKVKSAKEWGKRIKAVENNEKDGIAKREGNITARKESKLGIPESERQANKGGDTGGDKKGGGDGGREGGRNKAAALGNRKRAGFEGKTGSGFLNGGKGGKTGGNKGDNKGKGKPQRK